MNIAIVGKMGSGKSSLANHLVDVHKYTRVANAGALKALAAMAYGPIDKGAIYEITDEDGLRQERSGREILQGIGQTLKLFDRDIWLKAMMRVTEELVPPFVCDDTRFPFEADFLRKHDWLIVKLYVPSEIRMERYKNLYGRYPTDGEMNHPSETEVDKIDEDLLLSGQTPVAELVQQIFDHVETRYEAIA